MTEWYEHEAKAECVDLRRQVTELERERDTLRADVERWVKEVAHLKLSAEKAERISNEPSR